MIRLQTCDSSILRRMGLLLCTCFATGCSLILDPELCAKDSDCPVGVCRSGSCIGAAQAVEQDDVPTTQADMASGGMDTSPMPIDAAVAPETTNENQNTDAVAATTESVSDNEEPSPVSDGQPPQCLITATENPTKQRELNLTIEVNDSDSPTTMLRATLNGEDIRLNGAGQYVTRVPIQAGENRFIMSAEDDTALTCEAELMIIGDHTPPTFEALMPDADSVIAQPNGDIVITGRVIDREIQQTLEITLNGTIWLGAEVTWTAERFELTASLPRGHHVLEFEALDAVGNRSTRVAYEIIIDDTAPLVVLDGVELGLVIEHTARNFPLHGRVTDGVQALADNTEVNIVLTGLGEPRRYQAPTRPDGDFHQVIELFDEDNEVVVCAMDKAGNEGCSSPLRIFRIKPCIDIISPVVSTVLGEDQVRVSGTVCPGVRTVEAYVGTSAVDSPASAAVAGRVLGTDFVVNVPLRIPGMQTIHVTAKNLEQEEGTDDVRILFDPTPPDIHDLRPTGNACLGREAHVCVRVNDDLTDVDVVKINGSPVTANEGDYCWYPEVPISSEVVSAVIEATNRAGRRQTLNTTFTMDVDGPNVALQVREGIMVGEVNWYATGADLSIEGRVGDQDCGVAQFTIGGEDVSLNAENGAFEHVPQLNAGLNTLEYRAVDHVGNESRGQIRLGYDDEPPLIEPFEPESDEWLTTAQHQLTLKISDQYAGVASVSASVCDALDTVCVDFEAVRALRLGPGVWQSNVDLVAGENLVKVVAVDRVGHVAEKVQRMSVDLQAPSIIVDSPGDRDFVRWPFIIRGSARGEDTGSGVAEVRINGYAVDDFDTATGRWSYSVDPETFDTPIGLQTMSLSVEDHAGNVNDERTLDVRVAAFGRAAAEQEWTVSKTPEWMGLLTAPDGRHYIGLIDETEAAGARVIALDSSPGATRSLFPEATEFGSPAVYLAVDVDADDAHELVVLSADHAWLFSQEGGATFFGEPRPLPGGVGAFDLVAGHFNDDAHLDLVMLANQLTLYVGDGDGSFQLSPDAFDLGFENEVFRQIRVLANDDAAGSGVRAVQSVVAWSTTALGIWDWDSQGKRFVPATFNPIEDTVIQAVLPFAYRGGQSAIQKPQFMLIPADLQVELWEGGLDGWQDDDLDARSVFEQLVTPPQGIAGLLSTDFDQNGRDDVLVLASSGVTLWRRQGPHEFEPVDSLRTGLPFGADPVSHGQVVDLDADGDQDVILLVDDTLRVYWSNSHDSNGQLRRHFSAGQ